MSQSTGYRIRNWVNHFEVAQSRRRPEQKNNWVAFPNKHDGATFRRITREPEAERLFCAWCLIVEVASKCNPRGELRNSDGWLTPEDLADKTGFRPDLFHLALPFFASPRIAWLEAVPFQSDRSQTEVRPQSDHGQTAVRPQSDQATENPAEIFALEDKAQPETPSSLTAVRPQSDRSQTAVSLQTDITDITDKHAEQEEEKKPVAASKGDLFISDILGRLKSSETSLCKVQEKDIKAIIKAFPSLGVMETITKAIAKAKLVQPISPAPWLFSFFERETAPPRKGLTMYELKQKLEALQAERTRLLNYPEKNREQIGALGNKIKETAAAIRNFGESK